MKTCSECKIEKDISSFPERKSRSKNGKPYYRGKCKSCFNKVRNARRLLKLGPLRPLTEKYGKDKVCPEWRGSEGVKVFLREVGPRPSEEYFLYFDDSKGQINKESTSWKLKGFVDKLRSNRVLYRSKFLGVTWSISQGVWIATCGGKTVGRSEVMLEVVEPLIEALRKNKQPCHAKYNEDLLKRVTDGRSV